MLEKELNNDEASARLREASERLQPLAHAIYVDSKFCLSGNLDLNTKGRKEDLRANIEKIKELLNLIERCL